ncbi:MAG TPA: hypothetical protein VNK52_11065 [Hyphomicrobiaceae bacterium]|nr:hypothetical protein [Hyphomicrobiaceae bacterium]
MRASRPAIVLAGAAIAALAFAAAPVLGQGQFTPTPETPEQFPDGPHREEAFYFCSACHGFKIVAAQGMSRERWDERLTWMTQNHNMPKLEGAEREKMLDYLSTAFPERRQPGGWKNPFAPK